MANTLGHGWHQGRGSFNRMGLRNMRIQIFKVNTENGLEVQGVRQGVRAPAVLKEMGTGHKSRKAWHLKTRDHGYLITLYLSFYYL